jgi:hypothetical protein
MAAFDQGVRLCALFSIRLHLKVKASEGDIVVLAVVVEMRRRAGRSGGWIRGP